MKTFAGFLYVMAVLIGSYGFWGTFTKAGMAQYDEMDAMYPFFALLIAIAILIIAFIMNIILVVKRRKSK